MKRKIGSKIGGFILVNFFLYLQQFQLSYSATIGIKSNLTMQFPWVLINILIVAIPFCIVLVIVRRIYVSIIVNAVIITIFSLVNYHILMFHGSPFLAGDIFSIATAINVMSEYYIIFDKIVLRLLAVFIIELMLWLLLLFIVKNGETDIKDSLRRITTVKLFVINIGCVILLFFSPFAIFKKSLFTWSWGPAMNEYGYGICFCNSIYSLTNIFSTPEGYNIENINIENSEVFIEGGEFNYPDIILILNETLCDLSVYSEITESEEIFSSLDNFPNIVKGYTVSSLIGGGTNNSEYELLTSNGMSVFNVSAPFISLNMSNANSIVSYLNDLGYITTGMHCGVPSNYSRNRVYSEIGFDKIILGKDNFKHYSENGNRSWLDSDNYLDMIQLYESYDSSPRFMYLLTYQNHGGYEQNSDSEDTVAITRDLGDLTDDVNEYLTSVEKSISAFEELIEYYNNQERNVIILMMGDHAPAFISELPSREGLSAEQQELAKRTVPYYVWSNMEIDNSEFSEYISMVDAVPLMLDAVDMPLTGYYKSIIQLHKEVPVRTNVGIYMDSDGMVRMIAKDDPYYEKIQNYYYLEYNNVSKKDDYNRSWFELLQ